MFLCVQATKVRDSMAKTLYSALFDWIILHINHALLNRRDMEESVSVSHMMQLRVALFKKKKKKDQKTYSGATNPVFSTLFKC